MKVPTVKAKELHYCKLVIDNDPIEQVMSLTAWDLPSPVAET